MTPNRRKYVPWSRFGCFVGGALWGTVAGILIGAFVYTPLITARDPMRDTFLHDKIEARHQRDGVIYGMPIGALCGLIAGGGMWLLDRKNRAPLKNANGVPHRSLW